MNANTLEKLRQALIERQQELTVGLEHMNRELLTMNSDQGADHSGIGNHLADDGSALGEQERISTVGEDFRRQLEEIDAALARIDDGTYGKCKRCGKSIKVDRLRASPFAAHCIECQAYLERQASLFGTAAPR